MMKIGWRLGLVTRLLKNEEWYGVDAATGLTEEQFMKQIDRIEIKLQELHPARSQTPELHIRFAIEVHLFDH